MLGMLEHPLGQRAIMSLMVLKTRVNRMRQELFDKKILYRFQVGIQLQFSSFIVLQTNQMEDFVGFLEAPH